MKKYSKYKDSGVEWIGEIPEHWNISKVSRTFLLERGRVISKEEIEEKKGVFPVYSSQTENNGELGRIDSYDFEGDYITWTTDGANAGTCFFRSGKFNTTNVCGMLSPKGGSLILKFYNFFLNLGTKRYVRLDINPKLMNNMMGEIPIVVLPLSEQQEIVTYLDQKTTLIDQIISGSEKKIELLKEQRTATINHAVTKGLNPKVKMKDSGVEWIGEIPEGWGIVKLGHYSKIVRGASPRPAGDSRFFDGDFIPWITVAEVTGAEGKFITKSESFLTEEGMNQSRVLDSETLVLSNSGATLGVPKILKIKGCINDGSVGFIDFNVKLTRDFLYHFFTTQTKLLREQQSGYGQPNLNTEIISAIKVPLPNIQEQQEIVIYLDQKIKEIDDLISSEQKRIELMKEYRQSLISEVVTGKIKVTNE